MISRLFSHRNFCTLWLGMACCLGMVEKTWSCSCLWIGDWDDYAKRAAFIFTGKAIQKTVTPPKVGPSGEITFSSADPIDYVFQVKEGLKGVYDAAVRVRTSSDAASCGISFLLDSNYLVFAYKSVSDTVFQSNLCSGNQRLGSNQADSILTVVKAGLATNAVRDSRDKRGGNEVGSSVQTNSSLLHFRQEGALKNLESRERRLDGRSRKPAVEGP